MKKTLIIACALTLALSSASFAATVTKNVGGAKVTVTKATPKTDAAVKNAQANKAKAEKAKADVAKAKANAPQTKAQAKANAKTAAKNKANKKLNQKVNSKGAVQVKLK